MTYGLHSGVLYIPSKRELLCSWVPCASEAFVFALRPRGVQNGMLIQTNVLPLCWTELLLTLVQGVAMSTTAFMLLCPLRSNAAILRLPFELWPLADI